MFLLFHSGQGLKKRELEEDQRTNNYHDMTPEEVEVVASEPLEIAGCGVWPTLFRNELSAPQEQLRLATELHLSLILLAIIAAITFIDMFIYLGPDHHVCIFWLFMFFCYLLLSFLGVVM